MSFYEEKQEEAGQKQPFFTKHFQAFVQEIGCGRTRNIEDFGDALVGKVLVEFQMDDFLLPRRKRLDNVLYAGELFGSRFGED